MTLRVLHIFAPNYRLRFTGPVIQWRYHFNHWNEPGISHFVLDAAAGKSLPAKEALNFELTGAHQLLTASERTNWVIDLFRSLTRLRGSYDLLHVHILWWGSLLLAPWAKRRQLPALYESVLLGSDTPSSIRNEKFGALKLKFLQQYAGILAISDFLAQDYLANGFSPEQVLHLQNSVDVDLFHPVSGIPEKEELREKHHLPPDSTILLFVGSLIHRKGFDTLVRAFIAACKQNQNLFLLAVGPSKPCENPSLDETFIKELSREIANEGLGERVRFTGLIQERDVLAELYRAANLFVLPSRNEGLPGVLLEAMASGLVPVVTDLPVLRSVIRQGVNGAKVSVGDAQALSELILQLCQDPGRQAELAKQAVEDIRAKHGFPAWQQNISEYYYALHRKAKR
ncbi:MAG: glycosyltransferase family 4 protein [Anaerolineaceae bacterium]|jgi:glycosyltransferase involved in cell wall biosynthesis